MRLRLIQKDITATDLVPYVNDAANSGADLICFGELAATGCLYRPREIPSLDSIIETFAPYSLGIMFGVPRHTASGLRNSYIYIHGRRAQVYDKINLFPPFHEDDVYEAGETPGLFTTPFGDFGVAICYDLRFDSLFARLADLAVPYIIVPAAFPRVRIEDWRSLLIRRAIDTQATIIGINAVGSDGTNEFGGSSMVVAPDGSLLAMADETTEQLIDLTL